MKQILVTLVFFLVGITNSLAQNKDKAGYTEQEVFSQSELKQKDNLKSWAEKVYIVSSFDGHPYIGCDENLFVEDFKYVNNGEKPAEGELLYIHKGKRGKYYFYQCEADSCFKATKEAQQWFEKHRL